MNKSYECYSKPMYGYLTMNGIRYEKRFVHKTTKKTCWVYKVNDEFSSLLVAWSNRKK